MKKKIPFIFLFLSLIALVIWVESIRIFPNPRAQPKILDRNGILLAQEDNLQFGYRTWVPLSSMSPTLVAKVLEQEDRRFYRHGGIDPLAILRALWVNLRAGRLEQGGSTITQQWAKILLENRRGKRTSRNLFWKSIEALLALDCELHGSKKEILERYLNNVYLGHRLYGIEAASQSYFGKSNRDLTADEISQLLLHLRRPNTPQDRIAQPHPEILAPHLMAMLEKKFETMKTIKQPHSGGEGEALSALPMEGATRAPMIDRDPLLVSTVEAGIQSSVSKALRRGIENLRNTDPALQGAAVVIDIKTGELRALVGSADFQDPLRGGQVNHATALRQPGSTIKPFTYFLAFLHHRRPADLVIDAPYQFYGGDGKSYTPQNFDRRFHGVMPIREALANSYNIPAVLTLEEMGTPFLLELLHRFGFSSLTESPEHYGLALTLGSGAVTLLEITNAYAALARGGEFVELKTWIPKSTISKKTNPPNPPFSKGDSVVPPFEKGGPGGILEIQAAFLITSILSDPEARRRAFGDASLMTLDRQPVAVKTGTSHDSRDAWAVGYTPYYAVGVWTGHTDNSPMPGLTGAEAAIPIWHEIMAYLHKGLPPAPFPVPDGMEAQPFCRDEACDIVKEDWEKQTAARGPQMPPPEESFRFLRPGDGDHFLLDRKISRERQQILFEVRVPPKLKEEAQKNDWQIQWRIDGEAAVQTDVHQPKTFLTMEPGKHTVKALLGEAKTRTLKITLSENQ